MPGNKGQPALGSPPRRGELYWARLDPALGSEAASTRPVLVVSSDANNRAMPTVTVVPLTSSVHRVYPFEVYLEAGEGGLDRPSKVQAQQARTVARERLVEAIGPVSEASVALVEAALRLHLALG